MAHNTQSIEFDVNGKPIPQYFNPEVNAYEPLKGRNGTNRVEIYGPDGSPLSSTSGKLNVRASEIETLLSTLNGKDFATQATLAAILAKSDISVTALRDALKGASNKTLTDIVSQIQALEQKIDGIIDGTTPGNVALTGSIETVVDNPATGIKTITATAAELFAGAYAKTNRRKLIIKNEDQSLRFRIGKADITQQNGFPVEPGAVVIIPFDPAVIAPIYAISEGASLQASVMEV